MISKTTPFDKLLESILFNKRKIEKQLLIEAGEGVGEFDDLEKGLGFDAAGKRAEGNDLDHAAKMYNNLHEIYLDLYEGVEEILTAINQELMPMFKTVATAAGAAGSRISTLSDVIKRKNTALEGAKAVIQKLEEALTELGVKGGGSDEKLGQEVQRVKERLNSLAQGATEKDEEIKKLKRRGQEEREMYEMMLDDYEELVRRIDLERRRALKLLSIANKRLELRRTGGATKRVDVRGQRKAAEHEERLRREQERTARGDPSNPLGKMNKKMKKFMAKEETEPAINRHPSKSPRIKGPGDW